MTVFMSEPSGQSSRAAAAEQAAQAAHEARMARAVAEARAATALPRYWPAWLAAVLALTAAASHLAPWGFAPSASTPTEQVHACPSPTSKTPSR